MPAIAHRLLLLPVLLAGLALAGCGIELNPPREETQYRSLDTDQQLGWAGLGNLVNLRYEGSGESGISDEYGLFSYRAGDSLDFYIGNLLIGSAPGAPLVTPLELTGASEASDPRAINLSRLLLSLDADENPDNGIELPIDARSDIPLELDDETRLAALLEQLAPGRVLVDAATAQARLEQTLEDIRLGHLGNYLGEWKRDSGDTSACPGDDEITLSLNRNDAGDYLLEGNLGSQGNTALTGQLQGHSTFNGRIEALGLALQGRFANGIARGQWQSDDGACQGRFEASLRTTWYRDDTSIRSSAFQRFYISRLDGSESIDFGAVEPDQTIARTFEFVNDTDSDFPLNRATQQGQLSNGFAYSYSCETLAPGEACLVILTFLYQTLEDTVEEGEKTATLDILPGDPTNQPSLSFNLGATVKTGTGDPLLVVTPDLVGFSQSVAGVASEPQRLFLANSGVRPLYLLPIFSNNPAFEVLDDGRDACHNRLLKRNQSCYLDIRFTPPANAEDRFTVGTLIVRSDDPARRTAGITLEGYTGTDIRCFIATAAYGSYLDPHVATLRRFRDQVLLGGLPGGEQLVSLYYHYSPPLAEMVRQHEALRWLVRAALTPVVFAIEWPLTSLLLLLTSMFVWRLRRLAG